MLSMTKTDIAKMAVSMTLAIQAKKLVKQEIEERTSLDTDTVMVQVGTAVAAELVAYSVKPYTDKAVDIVVKRGKSLLKRNPK